MPAKNRVLIGSWMTPEEKREVTGLAQQVRLTTSELVRRLVIGRRLPDTGHYEAVIALVKINADLARLGNLLRMALDDPDFNPPEGMDLKALLNSVRETQATLKTKIVAFSS